MEYMVQPQRDIKFLLSKKRLGDGIHQKGNIMKLPKPFQEKPLSKILEAIDHVARVFLNPDDPLRQEAELQLASLFSKEMASSILNRLFQQLTHTQLFRMLEEEIHDPRRLDTFRPRRHHTGFTRAYGPKRITHILPGNIPDIAVMSLVFALIVKSASIAKISAKAPSLAPLFLRALQNVDKALAESIVLIPSGDDEKKEIDAALHWANLVILYGSDQTIEAVCAQIPPRTKTVVYGQKYSIGIVSRENISSTVAEAIAQDITLYDQRGCLSPHLYYVECPTEAASQSATFAQWVAEALERIPPPYGPTLPETASMIQQLRGTIPLKGGVVFASKASVDWTVLHDPDPSFALSPGGRTIFLKPVADISEIPHLLEPVRSALQAVGVAVPPKRLPSCLHALGDLGVSRICPIGKMQEPPLTWHHDGRFRILDLLHFVDWEGEEAAFG